MEYSIIYVGAGIASLYSAYTHLKHNPTANILILEKTNHIGGRVSWTMFKDIEVVKGAGVGRYKKDKLLLNLLIELEIPYTIHKSNLGNLNIKHTLLKLKENKPKTIESFKDFAIRILGIETYTKFKINTGFTDYEKMDAKIAIEHYGFEDTYGIQEHFFFSWHKLIDLLKEKLNIKLYQEVMEVHPNQVKTNTNIYTTKHVVVGTTITSLQKFFPTNTHYKNISSQPFIRIYAKLNKPLPINKYTVVDTPLQKIIPIQPQHNIYMISYSDNDNALILKDADKSQLEKYIHVIFANTTIKIKTYRKFFIKAGTHYYKPGTNINNIHKLQYPIPTANIHVIGEVVAINQGWVNSALKTTEFFNFLCF